jgi:hypothetical protein
MGGFLDKADHRRAQVEELQSRLDEARAPLLPLVGGCPLSISASKNECCSREP